MESNNLESQRQAGWAYFKASWRGILDIVPTAAYACDAQGLITYFNPVAEALWGRAPKLRDTGERYCGSYKLYLSDGSPIRHEECWMALALLEGKAYTARELVVERRDGTRVVGEAYAYPLRSNRGRLIGAVNLVADITAQRDPGANGAKMRPAPLPKDAALAVIEVAASVLTVMPWEPSVFN